MQTLRRECLDWILILRRRHLERVARSYISHYSAHRPHRALDQRPPTGKAPPAIPRQRLPHIDRRDRLGGLLHETKPQRRPPHTRDLDVRLAHRSLAATPRFVRLTFAT